MDLKTNIDENKEKSIEKYLAILPKYTFKDMILPENIVEQFRDILAMSQYDELLFQTWGLSEVIKRPRHIYVNLYGHPGTGKTMAAHAFANELGKKLICVNYAEIESKYVGETAKNLVSLFDAARNQKAILFFDEADALLSRRVTNMTSSTDVSVNQTRSVLLTLLDEYTDMVIFTTNFITNFDPAFMRRINYHIQFKLPDEKQRKQLWQHYLPAKLPAQVDIEEISQKYSGITGNDISNAVIMAALKSARLKCNTIPQKFFEDAIEMIKESTFQNAGEFKTVRIEERDVSEEYVKEQLKVNRS